MTMLASQITSLPVVCSIVYSDVNQRKHQSSASLAFVREIHRGPVNFPHKWPVTRKMFPFDDVIMDWTSQEEKGVASKVPITISFNEPLEYVFRTYAGHIPAPADKSSICNYVHCNVMCGMKSFIHSQTLWSLRMDKRFHPALYQACDYLSLLGLKLNHVNEMDRRFSLSIYTYISDQSVAPYHTILNDRINLRKSRCTFGVNPLQLEQTRDWIMRFRERNCLNVDTNFPEVYFPVPQWLCKYSENRSYIVMWTSLRETGKHCHMLSTTVKGRCGTLVIAHA